MDERDPRPYFTVANEFPRHWKVRQLSDTAFRLYIEVLADCNQYRTDGKLSNRDINIRGTKAAKELVEAGLVEKHSTTEYAVHDYLKHQKSRTQLSELSQARSEAAVFGNHERHHVKKRIVKAGCPHCPTETGPG
jgi:hypothetical protein